MIFVILFAMTSSADEKCFLISPAQPPPNLYCHYQIQVIKFSSSSFPDRVSKLRGENLNYKVVAKEEFQTLCNGFLNFLTSSAMMFGHVNGSIKFYE